VESSPTESSNARSFIELAAVILSPYRVYSPSSHPARIREGKKSM
jgi:hypothetical protein